MLLLQRSADTMKHGTLHGMHVKMDSVIAHTSTTVGPSGERDHLSQRTIGF